MTTKPVTTTTDSSIPDDKHWNLQRAKLKLQYPRLTARDLYFKHGRKEEMMEKLREKLGMTKEELQQVIAGL